MTEDAKQEVAVKLSLEEYLNQTIKVGQDEANRLESKFGYNHEGATRVIAKLRHDAAVIEWTLRGYRLQR